MKLLLTTILSLALLLTISCAGTQRKIIGTKRPPIYEHPVIETAETKSPVKELLKEGISYLKSNKENKAEWNFEEAIKLDPDYGPAYYWLARARYRLDKAKEALSLLEKAENLLKKSRVWLKRIDKFKDFLLEKTTEQSLSV